jgi:hypothetical protein
MSFPFDPRKSSNVILLTLEELLRHRKELEGEGDIWDALVDEGELRNPGGRMFGSHTAVRPEIAALIRPATPNIL